MAMHLRKYGKKIFFGGKAADQQAIEPASGVCFIKRFVSLAQAIAQFDFNSRIKRLKTLLLPLSSNN